MIKVIGKRLFIPPCDRLIGFEGDNGTKTLYFSFQKAFLTDTFGGTTDLAFMAKLQGTSDKKATAYLLMPQSALSSEKECVYSFDILSGMVKTVGEVKLQLQIVKDMGKDEDDKALPDLEWNSEIQSFIACDSLDYEAYTGSTGEAQTNVFKEILVKMGAESAKAAISAEEAAASAESAKGYALSAESAASRAEEAASGAAASAASISGKAAEAATSAKSASSYADKAKGYAADAEKAADVAEEAKSGAESAKVGAESAKSGAETARSGAESAKAAASTAATNAASAALNAENACEKAEGFASLTAEAAEEAKDNAQASLLHMNETERFYTLAKEASEPLSGRMDALDVKLTDKLDKYKLPSGTVAFDSSVRYIYASDGERTVMLKTVGVEGEPDFGTVVTYGDGGLIMVGGIDGIMGYAATTDYVDKAIGDIDTALDGILTIQNNLIGGATT